MYSELTRPITEQDLEELLNKARQEARGSVKPYLGCLTIIAAIAGLAYFYTRDSDSSLVSSVCGFVIAAAIAGTGFFRGYANTKEMIRTVRKAMKLGTARERRIVASRSFRVEKWQDIFYYLDVGDEGTLVMEEGEFRQNDVPNPDMTIVDLLDSKGIRLDTIYRFTGDPLEEVESFDHDEVVCPDDLSDLLDADSMTLLDVSFDDFLRMLRDASPPAT